MAKEKSSKKLLKEAKKEKLKEIIEFQKKLKETDPTFNYVEHYKTTDKNGNEIFKEGIVCPYSDLQKGQAEAIDAYLKLCGDKVNVVEILKIVIPSGLNVLFYIIGLEFEKYNCFKFETFKNFLRKPK